MRLNVTLINTFFIYIEISIIKKTVVLQNKIKIVFKCYKISFIEIQLIKC
jgi:hypothetical protein